MPERNYRGEQSRDYGSADRQRSTSRRDYSPSNRRGRFAQGRDGRDRNGRYRDERRRNDRNDEGHRSYDMHRGGQVEATGSSEMRTRRRREDDDENNSHSTTRNALKRERSVDGESESAKRRRSSGDVPPLPRRDDDLHGVGNHFRPRYGGGRDSQNRAMRPYDQYPREDIERSAPSNGRYSRYNEEPRSHYDRHLDRNSGRRSRRDYESGEDEERTARPFKRRAGDASPPRDDPRPYRRAVGSPDGAETGEAPDRTPQRARQSGRGYMNVPEVVPAENGDGRGSFSRGNRGDERDHDAQIARYHEMRNSRPTGSGRNNSRRDRDGHGHNDDMRGERHERVDQARDEYRFGFGPRGRGNPQYGFGFRGRNEQTRDGPRDSFGRGERDDQRFRGGRQQGNAQFDRRRNNRFDGPRPSRGRGFGGPSRGGFQGNQFECDEPTVVKEIPFDPDIVHDENIFRYGSVIYVEEVWSENTPEDDVPEVYEFIEQEMRKNGKHPSGDETKKEKCTQKADMTTSGKNEELARGNRIQARRTNGNECSKRNAGMEARLARCNSDSMTVEKENDDKDRKAQRSEKNVNATDGMEIEVSNWTENCNKNESREKQEGTNRNKMVNGKADANENENGNGQRDESLHEEGADKGNEAEMEAEHEAESGGKKDDGEKGEGGCDAAAVEECSSSLPSNEARGTESGPTSEEKEWKDEAANDDCSPVNVIVRKKEKE